MHSPQSFPHTQTCTVEVAAVQNSLQQVVLAVQLIESLPLEPRNSAGREAFGTFAVKEFKRGRALSNLLHTVHMQVSPLLDVFLFLQVSRQLEALENAELQVG